MPKALLHVCKLLFALLPFTAFNVLAQPKITSFSPAAAPAGTAITISGSGFNATPSANVVFFGALRATVTGGSATSITATAPASATYQPLSVLNTATGLSGYASGPFITTFTNPFGTGIPPGFYRPEVDIAVKDVPSLLAIGDIDGDGKADLVLSTASSLAVLRNISASGSISAASFAAEVDFPAGGNPTAVAIADLDGDGKPDLAVTNGNTSSVSVFRNLSVPGSITAASLAPRVDFSTGGIPTSVAAGDLDGDGKADLAVVNSLGTTVAVLRNTAVPGSITISSFAAKTEIEIGYIYHSLVIADLDGDKKPDITVAGEYLSVLRNISTSGTLTAASFAAGVDFGIGSGAQYVSAADLDGDGRPELISTGHLYDSVSVLRNMAVSGTIAAASFAPAVNFGVGSQPVCNTIADLNGDGKPDIVTSNAGDNTISVLSNSSAPGSITAASFAPNTDFLSGDDPGPATIGDLDGDGIPEVAVISSSEKNISVFRIGTPASNPVPVITGFIPVSGQAGATVTISGFNFNASAAGNTVYFGAVKASIVSGSTTSLTVKVPAGATYKPLTVLNNATGRTASSALSFIPAFVNPYGNVIPSSFYQPRVEVAAGTLPYAIALGDLDGDGKSDMVVVNESASTISILRNISVAGSISSASFAAKVDLATGNDPRAIAIGDLDADGRPDIVVTNSQAHTISVWRNTAVPGSLTTASFAPRVDFVTGFSPFSVAIGDLDGDGKPDLAVANLSGGTVSVLRNTSAAGSITAASFAAKVDFSTSDYLNPSSRSVAIGDLDDDGKPEIVVANERTNITGVTGTVTILHNNAGSGGFTASSFSERLEYFTDQGSNCVAIGDLDGDGKPDLAVSNYGSNTVSLLKNNFAPGVFDYTSFAYSFNFSTSPQPFFVAIADADGDGRPDLISANSNSNTVTLLRNVYTSVNTGTSGNGFAEADFEGKQNFAAGGYPVAVAVGDLNGDGTAELATANAGTNNVSLFKIMPPGVPVVTGFSPASGPAGTAVTITGSSFNSTPAGNIVYFGAVKGIVTGGTATSLSVTAPAGATYNTLSVLNIANGLTGYASRPFSLTFTNPFGTGVPANFYRPKVDFPTGNAYLFGVVFGDMDGDGKPDMVAVNRLVNTVSVLRNISTTGSITAASFAGRVDFAAGANPQLVAVSDVDGDGKPDIVVGNPAGYGFSVLRNTAVPGSINAGSFAARVDFSTGVYLSSLALGDLDGDGKTDIVVTNLYSGTISVLRNTATAGTVNAASFASRIDYVAGDYPRAVAICDVNGDGKPEIVAANENSSNVSVFWNLSTFGNINQSSFSTRFDFPAGSNPPSLAVGDVDGDGRPDIVVANYGSSMISVLRNTTTAGGDVSATSFAPKIEFATGLNPYYLAMGDADGDGKADLVTANSNDNTISVLRNTSTAGSITASSFAPKADFSTGAYPLYIAIGDLDGDGLAEIASANAGNGSISVFKISAPGMLAAVAAAPAGTIATDDALTDIRLFPNPTKGEFVLELQHLKAPVVELEILHESGAVIERRKINVTGKEGSTTLSLSLRNRPAGLYYVKVTGTDGVRIIKVIVQR